MQPSSLLNLIEYFRDSDDKKIKPRPENAAGGVILIFLNMKRK